MRADVKLGVAVSAVLVSVVGGYFTFRGSGTPAAPTAGPVESAIDSKGAKDAKTATPVAQPGAKRVLPKSPAVGDPKGQTPASPDASQPNRRRPVAPVTPSTGQPVAPGATTPAASPGSPPALRPGSPTSPVHNPTAGQPNAAPGVSRSPATSPASSGPVPGSEPTNPAGVGERGPDASTPRTGDGAAGATPTVVSSVAANPASAPSGADGSAIGSSTASHPGIGPNPGSPPTASPAGNAPAPSPSGSPPVSGGSRTPLSATAPASNPAALNPAGAGAPRTERPVPADRNLVATDTHRVQSGDTFASLAKNYYGNERYARFLKESNPQLGASENLSPGSVVRIPATPKDVAPDPTTSSSNGGKLSSPATPSAGAPAVGGTRGGKTYQVRTGDSFYSIARSTLGDSKRWKELYELNRTVVRDDPKSLRPGQVLTLPEK